MSQTREETARAFAEAMGWELSIHEMSSRVTVFGGVPFTFALILPAPDAPLHEHLAFVGRIAEALGLVGKFISWERYHAGDEVQFHLSRALASDPSWAAMLAAIAARGAK